MTHARVALVTVLLTPFLVQSSSCTRPFGGGLSGVSSRSSSPTLRANRMRRHLQQLRGNAFSLGDVFPFLQPKSSADVESLKTAIREKSKGTNNGVDASPARREEIAELLQELEAANPTRKLTSSPLISGSWKLLYTTNDGSSAGKIGPFVGDVVQNVELQDGEYVNIVSLANGAFRGVLTATWDNVSDKLWKVKFKDIKLELFGVVLQEKELPATGTWRMTYLDDDFRVLYAMGGKNQEKENVYVLAK
uniref:Plastid lipid-associated protein/fibrillin conserved domain-containing protein n=1 Tax=Lotharella globosa TaxID=91324 RepID=A0A7S4DWF7_9EUKA|mmetsp:Transcript_5152/g.10033  ORF Transcript_5152/g.10033 Transcript_5152/m.10033 type:complete len:249 (+) Transcript_5152:69-815(+)